jgi:hypothetical protein
MELIMAILFVTGTICWTMTYRPSPVREPMLAAMVGIDMFLIFLVALKFLDGFANA